MEKLYTISKSRPGADCGSDHTPYCKIQTFIEVGKTTRPFMYDLHQIPYDYTVEVTDSKD